MSEWLSNTPRDGLAVCAMEGRPPAQKLQTKAISHNVRRVLMETSVAGSKLKRDCKWDLPLPVRFRPACLQTSSTNIELLLIKTSHENEQRSRRSMLWRFALGRRSSRATKPLDVQRPGPCAAQGVEVREQVCLQRQRGHDQGHGRCCG